MSIHVCVAYRNKHTCSHYASSWYCDPWSTHLRVSFRQQVSKPEWSFKCVVSVLPAISQFGQLGRNSNGEANSFLEWRLQKSSILLSETAKMFEEMLRIGDSTLCHLLHQTLARSTSLQVQWLGNMSFHWPAESVRSLLFQAFHQFLQSYSWYFGIRQVDF